MLYQGISLMNIIRDSETFELWSASARAYELFSDTLNSHKISVKVPKLPWITLVYSELAPAEVYMEITVNWSKGDWLKVKAMKSKNNTVVRSGTNRELLELTDTAIVTELDKVKVQQTGLLKALDVADGMLTKALRNAKVSRMDYQSWMQTDRNFREAVNEIAEAVKDSVEGKLISEAQEGDMHAIRYFMDARGSDRGYGKNDTRVIEEQQQLDLSKLSLVEQQQLAKLIEKATPELLE